MKKGALARFLGSSSGVIGMTGVILLLIPALYAPFIANARPFFMEVDGVLSFPFARYLFAPDSPESFVEQFFNYFALLIPAAAVIFLLVRKRKTRLILTGIAALFLLVPFFTVREVVDKRNYRELCSAERVKSCFAPIKYGPFETASTPCSAPDKEHILGCDDIGRDVAARLIYGARSSLAVGIFSSLIALVIGCAVGLAAGFKRGVFDLVTMRFVEILLCFPSFLLLLILMSLLGDRQLGQSIPLVIAVLGLTGWIGIAFLVRGETLKQRNLPYVESCIVSGIPEKRIMFFHLLPNVMFPVLIAFTFGIAGAILAESSLSFLGFGVKAPAPSWGGLLRQAFDNPLDHWHLTFFPGAALFIAVMSFNFVGEGLRRALSVKE